MSDSDDISSSDVSEAESEYDVEMEPEGGEAEEEDRQEELTEMDGDEVSPEGSVFQKETWQLRLLPYSAELEKEADEYFRNIKAGLAHAVLLKDIRMGLVHWLCELEKYVNLYQRRMTKEDQVQLIHLLYQMVNKDQLFRDVKICCHILSILLAKRELLSASDLVLDWRPLYDLYYELSYKNLEEDGIFLLPEGFRTDVTTLIGHCRNYFPPETTRQLLDELRPGFCPWDESMIRSFKLLELFLPTSLTVEQHNEYGASLWLDEFWYWYEKVENNSAFDDKLLRIFARLAWDCPGLIDWRPYLDKFFTRMTRSLRLSNVVGLCQTMHMDTAVLWVTYTMGGPHHEVVQGYISRLFRLIESFCHPSNFGSHTSHLLNCLFKFSHHLVLRLKRERHTKKHMFNAVPPEMRLTDAQVDAFVQSMLPCVSLAIFSKAKTEYIPHIVNELAAVSPHIVLPAIMEIVNPALETVTEPHRLTSGLQCLLSVMIALVRDTPTTSDGISSRANALIMLEALLPGMDRNDITKSSLCFQIIGVITLLVPLSDCSEAVHVRSDLSADEKELCSATANMENIIYMITDKLLGIIEQSVSTSTAGAHPAHGALTKHNAKLSVEEQIIFKGVTSVFKGMCMNTSTPLFKIAMNKLYDFMEDALYDSKVAADIVGEMAYLVCRTYPELAFDRFLDLLMRNLKKHITAETYEEEHSDFAVIWWLTVATKLVRVPAADLLRRKETLQELLRLIMPLKSRTASHLACTVLEEMLRYLTSSYQKPDVNKRKNLDKPADQYLPIRHWAKLGDKKNLKNDWFVPTEDSLKMADELLNEWLYNLLETLRSPVKMEKSEILHCLYLVESAVLGTAFSLPVISGELVPLNSSPVFVHPFEFVVKPAGTPVLTTKDSGNVRELVLSSMSDLLNFLLREREDDVKSINMIIRIFNTVIFNRGCSKQQQTSSQNTYNLIKRLLGDTLRGNKMNVEAISREYIQMLHQKRIVSKSGYLFTQKHIDVIKMLIVISTSQYSENRTQAQTLLQTMFKEFPYSYNKVLDDIIYYLKEENNPTHEQLKGALYIIADGKKLALLLRQNWEAIVKLWPAIVEMKHSEKPSIVALIETGQNTIVDKFESIRIVETMPDGMRQIAEQILTKNPGSSQIHAPSKGMPSQEELDTADARCNEVNERNMRLYGQLCDRLLQLATDANLHWRHTDLAHSLLSLMIRRDVVYPVNAIRLYVKLLTHDTIKTRKMAAAVVGAWLKLNKPKAVKREWIVEDMEPNCGPGAKWPIKFGLRKDNRSMCYEPDKLPKTAEEYNNFRFCGKQHWGFYTWPEKLITYGTLAEQAAVNRDESELNETDQFIVDTFRDPDFSERLRTLMCVEEKKEDGDDMFNSVNFSLFQGLFRCYNDMLAPVFRKHLEVLCASEKEFHQKLAAEMVCGIINGSKLWRYEKQQELWAWLGPLLMETLQEMKEDSQKNWGVAMATVCGSSEARVLQPLIEVLYGLLDRPTESNYQMASRLFLVQGAVCQWEWRSVSLWHRLLPRLQPLITQGYQNLRERLGVCLTTIAWYELVEVYQDPSYPASMKLPGYDDVLTMIDPHLGPVWDEARLKSSKAIDGVCAMEPNGNGNGLNGDVDDMKKQANFVRKQSRLALKTLIGFMFNATLQSYVAWTPQFVNYVPLLAHFSNDVGDEELTSNCTSLFRDLMSTVLVTPRIAPHVVNVIEQFLSEPCWWKAKLALTKFLKMLIFSNLFVFTPLRERLGMILATLMSDCQIEVREGASEVFSGLVHCGFFEFTPQLLERFATQAASKSGNPVVVRHAGALGLASLVLAFPYSVPPFLPDVLMTLCKHATDVNPIGGTVKKALAEFKRTHQDSWHEHKTAFSDDQLTLLTDLLVSPNYYV